MELKAYEAAKHKAALIDVSAWGKLAFRGQDCKKFLHGLLTNDIQSLKQGQGLATCILTPKGKLIADFALYDLGENLLSIQLPQATGGIISTLSKPLVLSQTTIEDITRQWAAFLIIGPETTNILKDILDVREILVNYACAQFKWDKESLLALSYPVLAQEGILLLTNPNKAEKLRAHLMKQGHTFGLESIGSDTLEVLRIEAGVPALGVDTDEDTLPLELPLENTISFTKGCYMGQETTARIKNFGHVNRKWIGLKAQADVRTPADVFVDDKFIGKITSATQSPRLKATLGLGFLRSEYAVPGTKVLLKYDGWECPAEIAAIPI